MSISPQMAVWFANFDAGEMRSDVGKPRPFKDQMGEITPFGLARVNAGEFRKRRLARIARG